MTAYNIVRFRVKPGMEQEFVDRQRRSFDEDMAGIETVALVKTGDRTFCFVGRWESFESIVAARTKMIAALDDVRELLEDLGNGLGVTDPVSGEAVLEVHR